MSSCDTHGHVWTQDELAFARIPLGEIPRLFSARSLANVSAVIGVVDWSKNTMKELSVRIRKFPRLPVWALTLLSIAIVIACTSHFLLRAQEVEAPADASFH